MTFDLHCGDCRVVLAGLAPDSIDAVVTDPPYHLTSIVKRFGKVAGNFGNGYGSGFDPKADGLGGAFARTSRGFMGKQWDGGDIAFDPETWRAVYRVLKPGAHLIAMGGTRTYHRLACAIEDAGFEIRDTISWLYGSGFPKSHDVSKGIDRAAGAAREADEYTGANGLNQVYGSNMGGGVTLRRGAPATDAARQWEGWGTALKPSAELCVLAQKPFADGHYIDTIGSTLLQLWGQLWSMLSARHAGELSALSPSAFGVVSGSVQWSADDESNIRAALSARMDMSRFESALISSLSTVSSWAVTWAESWTAENTSTTRTELETTTDLRTLSYLLSRITADSIIPAHKSGRWLNADASNAERCFNAVVLRLQGILELSVVAPVLSKVAGDCRDVDVSPNLELIVLARKPLSEGTVAANVLRWGTGAININGCRVRTADDSNGGSGRSHTSDRRTNIQNNGHQETFSPAPVSDSRHSANESECALDGQRPLDLQDGYHPSARSDGGPPHSDATGDQASSRLQGDGRGPLGPDAIERDSRDYLSTSGDDTAPDIERQGRWPANVAHDGSAEVVAAFPDSDHARGNTTPTQRGDSNLGWMNGGTSPVDGGDTGSAARFFYTAKADAYDRLGSKHPTVKPLDLMQWLVRLVTPKGGTVLDPFAGTGTTGEAAWREGVHAVLIEAEAEYQADIRRRMALVLAGPDERSRESVKAKGLPYDPGPLFGGTDLNGGHVRKIYGEFEHDKTGKRYVPVDYGSLFK